MFNKIIITILDCLDNAFFGGHVDMSYMWDGTLDRKESSMSVAKDIIALLDKKYPGDDVLAGMVDEQMNEYVDTDQCEEEFDGNVYDCYMETGNNAAESDILNQIVRETELVPVDDDWEDIREWWQGRGFML